VVLTPRWSALSSAHAVSVRLSDVLQ